MIQLPTCVGLVLCEKYVVEENSRNLTLVNCCHQLVAATMPWTAPTFYVYFWLSDGIGNGKLTLEIAGSETLDSLHVAELEIRLDDPTKPGRFVLPVIGCTFERSGRYQASLFVDQELVALAVFDVEFVED